MWCLYAELLAKNPPRACALILSVNTEINASRVTCFCISTRFLEGFSSGPFKKSLPCVSK